VAIEKSSGDAGSLDIIFAGAFEPPNIPAPSRLRRK